MKEFIVKYWAVITSIFLVFFLAVDTQRLANRVPANTKRISVLEKSQIKDDVVNMYVNKLIRDHKH